MHSKVIELINAFLSLSELINLLFTIYDEFNDNCLHCSKNKRSENIHVRTQIEFPDFVCVRTPLTGIKVLIERFVTAGSTVAEADIKSNLLHLLAIVVHI